MKIIVCVDDNMGMLFNKRRQSRDKKIIEDILDMSNMVWIHSFSEKLFEENMEKVVKDDTFLEKADGGEICFVENMPLKPYESQIEQLVLYKWNRKYPSDFKLDLDLSGWDLLETIEFVGNSHEVITREIYGRGV